MKGSIMKKLVILLAMLLIASPAMAVVTVTAACDDANGVVTVSYTTDGEIVRAFALDVTVSDGNAIENVTNLSSDYYIAPGSVDIDDGAIEDGGDIVASDDFPGTLGGEGTSGVTIEMASLYADGEPAPGTSGDLFSFEVDTAFDVEDCVALALNSIRGGIVLENASAASESFSVCCINPPGCRADVTGVKDGMELDPITFLPYYAGTFDAKNDQVDTIDLAAFINLMVNTGDPNNSFAAVTTSATEDFDITGAKDGMELDPITFLPYYAGTFDAPNGMIDTIDLAGIINMMVNTGAPGTLTVACP